MVSSKRQAGKIKYNKGVTPAGVTPLKLFVIRLALELEAAGELNYALCTAGRERCGDTSEVGAVDIQGSELSREEIRPVENVESLETKLEPGPLCDPDVLD